MPRRASPRRPSSRSSTGGRRTATRASRSSSRSRRFASPAMAGMRASGSRIARRSGGSSTRAPLRRARSDCSCSRRATRRSSSTATRAAPSPRCVRPPASNQSCCRSSSRRRRGAGASPRRDRLSPAVGHGSCSARSSRSASHPRGWARWSSGSPTWRTGCAPERSLRRAGRVKTPCGSACAPQLGGTVGPSIRVATVACSRPSRLRKRARSPSAQTTWRSETAARPSAARTARSPACTACGYAVRPR